jgi:hypothetical protein
MTLVERIKSGKSKVSPEALIEKIADRVVGISYNDLSTAERQICDLLIVNETLTINEGEDWKPVERVK